MKLSVLITYHNEGEWLTECLATLLPQLAADDEVLVFDDASVRPPAPFLPADPRLRVLRSDANIGPCRARNELIRAARGSHLHFHDADDWFAPAWRARVSAAFTADVDVVFTEAAIKGPHGTRSAVIGLRRLGTEWDLLQFALLSALLVPSGTYTRALIDQVGGYREDLWMSEDVDFHIRMALLQPRYRVVPEDLILIREHAGQRSRDQREVWSSAIRALEGLVEQIPADARVYAAQAATRAGSNLFAIDARAEAARAFALARRFGGARYERPGMNLLSGLLGPLRAEQLGRAYRRLLPRPLRRALQRLRV